MSECLCITARPVERLKGQSSLVRRLVQAQDDPAKQALEHRQGIADSRRGLIFPQALKSSARTRSRHETLTLRQHLRTGSRQDHVVPGYEGYGWCDSSERQILDQAAR